MILLWYQNLSRFIIIFESHTKYCSELIIHKIISNKWQANIYLNIIQVAIWCVFELPFTYQENFCLLQLHMKCMTYDSEHYKDISYRSIHRFLHCLFILNFPGGQSSISSQQGSYGCSYILSSHEEEKCTLGLI